MVRGKNDSDGGCPTQPRRRLAALCCTFALSMAFSVQFAAAQPANDDCTTPTLLTSGVPVVGSNVGATGTDDTSLCGTNDTTDVWFRWTADCTADVTISTCGSGFNTTLAVFDDFCPIIFDIACANDECGTQSELIFSAFSGTDYLIRVAGDNGATGNYTISVTCPPIGGCCTGFGSCLAGVTEDECVNVNLGLFLGAGTDCSGTECQFGACCTSTGCSDEMGEFDCQSLSGTYQGDGTTCVTTICPEFGACCSPFDTSCSDSTQIDCEAIGGIYLGDTSDCATDGGACATGACCTPSSGCMQVDASTCGSLAGAFQGNGSSCTTFICSDDCDTATIVGSVPYTNQTDNSDATDGPDGQFGSCDGNVGNVGRDVWYRWTPASDCEATVSWTPLEGQDNVLIVWESFSSPPESDCIAGAFASTAGMPGPNEIDCQECDSATETCPDDDAPEVSTFFAQAGATYYFQCGQEGAFPDAGGLSEFSITCGFTTGGCCLGGVCTEQFQSQCDAGGGLYAGDGTDCSGGCPGGACCVPENPCTTAATQFDCENSGGTWFGDGVDCMDVICGGACCLQNSCENVFAESACNSLGGLYLGNGTSCETVVCNDDCANAIGISTGVTYNGTNVGATGTDESSCAGTLDVNDVWHTWVADCTDNVTFSLCGSGFDTTLAVFDGCGGTELACNDDNAAICGPGNNSELQLNVTAGTTYWIRIAGWNGANGNYALLVTCPPVGACCDGASCQDLSADACGIAGGNYLGDGTDCASNGSFCTMGACCLLDGSCSDGSEIDCMTMNGQFAGGATECSTTICPDVGACCTNGSCEVTFRNDCLDGGGEFLGADTICEADTCMGACCFDNACTIQDQVDCADAGEVFWGPGSTCEEVTCPGLGFVQLNNNWNGIAHPSEQGDPDRPEGYRTIGDRGLVVDTATSVGGGTYSVISGNRQYSFESRPDVLDMVIIGRRSVVAVWDTVSGDAGNIGIAPNWDPTGGTGTVLSNTTTLSPTLTLGADFEIGVLSHGTEGGGSFMMTLGFADATSVTVQLDAPDWFANGNGAPGAPSAGVASQALLTPAPLSGGDGFDAVASHDRAESGAPLNLTQGVVTQTSLFNQLGFDVTGKQLETITFDQWTGSTFSAGGIYAVSISVPGACCLSDGSCIDGLRSDCTAAAGTYQGDGTDCATSGAFCEIGACCLTNGTCNDDVTVNDCNALSGFYLGGGSLCATSSCPPTGGCCNQSTFGCTIDFGAACTSGGGLYLGDDSDCSFGCDCNNNATLDLFELLPSTDCDGNNVLDECESPDPSTVGACCIDEVCTIETALDCAAASGRYYGDCSDCSLIICPGPGFVDLNYNWNGVVHPGEMDMPDSLSGYRSIGDRGLISGSTTSLGGTTGILTDGNLTYWLEMRPDVVDIVHIGFRGNLWDLVVDGDNIGVAPNWDPSVAGNGSNTPSSTSTFTPSPVLNSAFEFGVLFHAAQNGGDFDMTLGFTDATSVTVSLNAPDWFAAFNPAPDPAAPGVASQALLPGPLSGGDGFLGAGGFDNGNTDQPLNTIQSVVTASSLLNDLGFDVTGKQLNSVVFNNWDPDNNGTNAGNAIFAASYFAPNAPACSCAGDVNGDSRIDGDDAQGFVSCLLGGGGDCSCADVDGMNGVDIADVNAFVTNLLTVGPACP